MPSPDRRTFLKIAGATVGAALCPASAAAGQRPETFDRARAKLYDATRCVGCRACWRCCREVNNLGPSPGLLDDVPFDMGQDLSPENWMVIQAYRDESGDDRRTEWSFVKKNCMHCNVPACASACPVAALQKTAEGRVLYHEDRCIGCRYCMLACPHGVPRYEWRRRTPRVRKCILCLKCVEACPVQALVSGTRRELLDEAHRRIRNEPGRYVDHVYGEHEGGGTSYLVLSSVPLDKLGFRMLGPGVRSSYADALMRAVPGWIIGLGLFLAGLHQIEVLQRAKEHSAAAAEDES